MSRNVNGRWTISRKSRCYLGNPFLYGGSRHGFLIVIILDERCVSVCFNYHFVNHLQNCLLTVTGPIATWGGGSRRIAPSESVGTKVRERHEREIDIFVNRLERGCIGVGLILYMSRRRLCLKGWDPSKDEVPPGITTVSAPRRWLVPSDEKSCWN